MIFKLLGWQGCAGLALSIVLGLLLTIQIGETRHWKKQSGNFEQLYHGEQAAHATTVANYRLAAAQARAADLANIVRVRTAQATITEKVTSNYETRLADAHARLGRLQSQPKAGANSGGGAAAAVPGLPTPTCGTDSPSDDPVTRAYTCALQLDALIEWTRSQGIAPYPAPDAATEPKVYSVLPNN